MSTRKMGAERPALDLPRRYPYQPSWASIFTMAIGFIVFPFFVYDATHNRVGLIINRVIKLGPTGATIVYSVMAVVTGLACVMAILSALRRMKSSPVLELGIDALVLPQGLYRVRLERIAYADIRAMSETKMSGTSYVNVVTVDGRKFSISGGALPNQTAYVDVRNFLLSQVRR